MLSLPIVALVVLAEEVMWRAVLMDAIRPKLGAVATLAVATAIYAIPQAVSGNWPLLAAAVGCGSVWGVLYLLRRDVVAPFACHMLWDVVVFVVWPVV